MIELTLPWPHKDLSPNSRKHWSNRARKAKVHRKSAHVLTMEALLQKSVSLPAEPNKIVVGLKFVPPANRHYDLDGLISRSKSSLDGIADALGVNDRRFTFGAVDITRAERPGKLVVTIQEAP